MKSIVFFSTKGGVGKTSLVYHLAWMFADLGVRVVAVDLDPQANLTSMLVPEERLEKLWSDPEARETVLGSLRPLLAGTGEVTDPHVEEVAEGIGLVVGDLRLSVLDEELNRAWNEAMIGTTRAFLVLSALRRVIEAAGRKTDAGVVLIDVAPFMSAVNRSALLSAEAFVVPLAPDPVSLLGLRHVGQVLRHWSEEWGERRAGSSVADPLLSAQGMKPAGYLVMQHAASQAPGGSHDFRSSEIPQAYREAVLGGKGSNAPASVEQDSLCLAVLKPYRSLMMLAQEARKPMFFLTPADGAIGGHARAVQDCYRDYRRLARTVAERCGVPHV